MKQLSVKTAKPGISRLFYESRFPLRASSLRQIEGFQLNDQNLLQILFITISLNLFFNKDQSPDYL